MADFIMTEGFDYYWDGTTTPNGSQSRWVKGFLDQSLVLGRFGGKAFRSQRNGGTEDVVRTLDQAAVGGLITCGFAFRPSAIVNTAVLYFENASGVRQFTVYMNSDGSVSLRAGTSGTVLATSAAGLITSTAWFYLEVASTVSNTGSAIVRLDNTTIINATSIDTQGAADTVVGRITIPEPDSGFIDYDDMYARDDLTMVGPSIAEFRQSLTAEVGDFNLSATSPYTQALAVGDISTDTASYMTGSAVGNEQLFAFEATLSSATSLHCVTLLHFAKVDTGTGTIEPRVSSGPSSFTGPAVNLNTTFKFISTIVATNPETLSAWSPSSYLDMRGGLRISGMSGGATAVQVSLVGVEVLRPISPSQVEAGGYRFWKFVPLTKNGGNRPGASAIELRSASGSRLVGKMSGGPVWIANANDILQAIDGRRDTAWVGDDAAVVPNNYVQFDSGGRFKPTKLRLGPQTLNMPESIETFRLEASNDGSNWITYWEMLTPQTGWVSTEIREFTIVAPVSQVRRRITAIVN